MNIFSMIQKNMGFSGNSHTPCKHIINTFGPNKGLLASTTQS